MTPHFPFPISHLPDHARNERGMILSAMLMVATFLSFVIFSILILASVNVNRAQTRIDSTAAQYAAESAVDAAIAQLNANTASPGTSGTDKLLFDNSPYYKIYYSSTITGSGTSRTVTGVGKTYAPATAPSPKITRTVSVTINQTTNGNVLGQTVATYDIQLSGCSSYTGASMYITRRLQLTKSGSCSPTVKVGNLYVAGDDGTNKHCSINGNANGSTTVGQETFQDYTTPPFTHSHFYLSNVNCNGGQITYNPNIIIDQNTNVPSAPSISLPWSNTMGADNPTSISNPPTGYLAGNPPGNYNTTGSPPSFACSTLGTVNAVTLVGGHYPDNGTGVLSSCTASSDIATAAANSGTVYLTSKTISMTDDIHIRANLCSATNRCQLHIQNISNPQKPVVIYVEGAIYADILSYVGEGRSPTYPVVLVSYSTNTNPNCAIDATVNAPHYALYAPNGDVCLTGGTGTLDGLGGKNIIFSNSAAITINASPNGSLGGVATWSAGIYRRL